VSILKGNPAGVCFPEQELSEHKMQNIATSLVFRNCVVIPVGKKILSIRYFSPKGDTAVLSTTGIAKAVLKKGT
jgi:predicted PhzF superfamily epimerase YddE/YHI9